MHNLLAPHTRLVQFFVSHFNATRLGSVDTQRIFLRLLDLTMDAMKHSVSHPMARDLRLRVILFSLRVLRVSSTIGNLAQLRLKDKVLSAALSWFKYSPKWSFGSNLLQLKTEVRLISDVMQALKGVAHIAGQTSGSYKSIGQKEALVEILLQSEQARLGVWINPTHEDRHQRPEIMNKHGREILVVS